MQLKRKKRQAGDTLVEVLLAFSIFGAAAVTITRAMNEAYSQMFVNGQQSQVQAHMRGQLAIIQAAHDAEVKDPNTGVWDDITRVIADTDIDKWAAVNADGCTYTLNKNRLFFPTAAGGTWTDPQFAPKVTDAAHQAVNASSVTPSPDNGGVWIEAKYTPPDLVRNTRGYYDFYAKSCWSDAGDNRQIKSVMRFYDLVVPPGEGSAVVPTNPPSDPVQVTTIQIPGNGYLAGRCMSINPLEGNELFGSPPAGALFSNPSGSYPCGPIVGNNSTVYTCTNYDIEYPSSVVVAGRYQMTLSYQDALCGAGGEALNAGGSYFYRLEVYVNGVRDGAMVLNPDVPTAVYTFNSLPAGANIGFRWWNNRFFNTFLIFNKDPDFVFRNIRLDYLQP